MNQAIESLVQKAKHAENENNLRAASDWYMQAASIALNEKFYDSASDLYMKAAINLERTEEWRQIGILWLYVAAALQGQVEPIGKGRYTDVDAAKHNFPTIDPFYWGTLSKSERIGRALRNSGYHLEKAGINQSAYKQYEMAGTAFRESGMWDEASRSYMLAARSYIRQHRELDPELLDDLINSLDELKKINRHRYFKRLIIYYRHLRVDLTDHGNTAQANELYIRECQTKKELYAMEKRLAGETAYCLWNITSRYGTSFNRWFIVSCIIAFILFPSIYIFIMSFPEKLTLGERIANVFIQSINLFLGKTEFQTSNTWLINLITLIEQVCGYTMLGSLAAMIIARITR